MLRLQRVVGYSNRLNNILFASGVSNEDKKQHVVFFPGDVQNYKDKMELHIDYKQYTPWCYENTASLLTSQFPNDWIWIIEPATMHDGIFSCYENFVTGDLLEPPENFDYFDAIKHLSLLIRSGVDNVNGYLDGDKNDDICKLDNMTCQVQEKETTGSNPNKIVLDLPLVLVGFSKGSVVLNQFTSELKHAEKEDELNSFIQSISAWYWLDGGHSKDHNTWITDEDALQDLTKLKSEVKVLVTPYQMKDKNRPNIGKEERVFVDTLKRLGCDIKEKMYFGEEGSLENHFRVLEKISDINN